MSDKEPQLKKRISIPKSLSNEARNALAENIIQFIKDRTANNKDVEGKKFHKYSDSYIASPDFKNAGKSANDVNLRLTDEMMESIELIDQGSGYITIGFKENTNANNKGVWAQRSDNGPSRMFLGISDKDLEKVLAKTQLEVPSTNSALSTAANSLTESILKRFGL